MSQDLYWELTKNNSCHLVRRGNCNFSTDPLNITNVHSKKFSGITSKKAVGISLSSEKKGSVMLTYKHSKSCCRPSKQTSTITFSKSHQVACNGIKNFLLNNYRPDLVQPAMKRVKALLNTQKKPRPLKIKQSKEISETVMDTTN